MTTTSLEEPVAEVRARVAASSYDFALVLAADQATLLGRLRPSVLDSSDPDRLAGEVMEPGPEDVPSSVELRWRPGDHQAAVTVSV